MDKNENTAERQALKRLANAVADHLGIGTQSTHLKGFAYSEAVRKELHAAYAEADAAIRATPHTAPVPLSDETIRLAKVALHEMPRPTTDWHEAAKRVCTAVVERAVLGRGEKL